MASLPNIAILLSLLVGLISAVPAAWLSSPYSLQYRQLDYGRGYPGGQNFPQQPQPMIPQTRFNQHPGFGGYPSFQPGNDVFQNGPNYPVIYVGIPVGAPQSPQQPPQHPGGSNAEKSGGSSEESNNVNANANSGPNGAL